MFKVEKNYNSIEGINLKDIIEQDDEEIINKFIIKVMRNDHWGVFNTTFTIYSIKTKKFYIVIMPKVTKTVILSKTLEIEYSEYYEFCSIKNNWIKLKDTRLGIYKMFYKGKLVKEVTEDEKGLIDVIKYKYVQRKVFKHKMERMRQNKELNLNIKTKFHREIENKEIKRELQNAVREHKLWNLKNPW